MERPASAMPTVGRTQMTENPYESPSAKPTAPPKCVKRANNLVRDARLAILVGLIPILGLIYILRLVQWYIVNKQLVALEGAVREDHAQLLKDFRSARPRLWFAVLFWPGLILFLFVYFAVT